MYTLQIEHGIKDFDMWKAAFDRDPLDRAGSGVQHFRVSRPTEDSGVVVVELDFETLEKADDMLGRLRSTVWNSAERAPALIGDPKTRIMETVYTGSH
ncbi:hypothetical protein [Paenarthrobacter nitroguajacolicus]|uniref:hypothetical protein n=1 Tax=Paenarthrobacter nitroguajacolicus TaxID=211146 RepID=UPI004054369D